MPFVATCMDLEIIILSEVSQKKKGKYLMVFVESKIWHKWTYLQKSNRLTDIENKHGYQKGKQVGRGKLRV